MFFSFVCFSRWISLIIYPVKLAYRILFWRIDPCAWIEHAWNPRNDWYQQRTSSILQVNQWEWNDPDYHRIMWREKTSPSRPVKFWTSICWCYHCSLTHSICHFPLRSHSKTRSNTLPFWKEKERAGQLDLVAYPDNVFFSFSISYAFFSVGVIVHRRWLFDICVCFSIDPAARDISSDDDAREVPTADPNNDAPLVVFRQKNFFSSNRNDSSVYPPPEDVEKHSSIPINPFNSTTFYVTSRRSVETSNSSCSSDQTTSPVNRDILIRWSEAKKKKKGFSHFNRIFFLRDRNARTKKKQGTQRFCFAATYVIARDLIGENRDRERKKPFSTLSFLSSRTKTFIHGFQRRTRQHIHRCHEIKQMIGE